jgi:hypothetical protein
MDPEPNLEYESTKVDESDTIRIRVHNPDYLSLKKIIEEQIGN